MLCYHRVRLRYVSGMDESPFLHRKFARGCYCWILTLDGLYFHLEYGKGDCLKMIEEIKPRPASSHTQPKIVRLSRNSVHWQL